MDDIVRICRDKVDPSHKFIWSYVEQLRDSTRRQYGLPAASRDDPLYPTAISIDVPRPNSNANSQSGTPTGGNGDLKGFPTSNWKARLSSGKLDFNSKTRLQLPSNQRMNRSGFSRSDEFNAESLPTDDLLASKGDGLTQDKNIPRGNDVQIPTTEKPPMDNNVYDRD